MKTVHRVETKNRPNERDEGEKEEEGRKIGAQRVIFPGIPLSVFLEYPCIYWIISFYHFYLQSKSLLHETESIVLVLPKHFSFVPRGVNASTSCFWLFTTPLCV